MVSHFKTTISMTNCIVQIGDICNAGVLNIIRNNRNMPTMIDMSNSRPECNISLWDGWLDGLFVLASRLCKENLYLELKLTNYGGIYSNGAIRYKYLEGLALADVLSCGHLNINAIGLNCSDIPFGDCKVSSLDWERLIYTANLSKTNNDYNWKKILTILLENERQK